MFLLALIPWAMACGASQVRPDQRPPDPALESVVVAQLSDSAALFSIPPKRFLASLPRAREVVGEQPLGDLLPGQALLSWAALEPGTTPGVLQGADLERPIVVGLRTTAETIDYAATVYGVTPDLTRPPTLLRLTILLPATDTQRLSANLTAWLLGEGATPGDLAEVDRAALGPQSKALALPREPGHAPTWVAVTPKRDQVAIEVLWPLTPTPPPDGTIAALMEPPQPRPLPRTPGLTHFLQNRGQLSGWFNLADWPWLSAWTGSAAGKPYLDRSGSGEAKVIQMMLIWDKLLTGARAMAPEHRLTEDVGLYIDLDDDLFVRVVETLTAHGTAAYRAGREASSPTWPVEAYNPVFTMRMGTSPRAMTEALNAASPELPEPSQALYGGPFSTITTLMGPSWLGLLGFPAEHLGDGGTLVLQGLAYPRGGGPPGLEAGLVLHHRAEPPPELGVSLGILLGLGEAVVPEQVPAQGRSQVQLALNAPLGELLDLDGAEVMEEAHIEVEVDLTRLDQIPWREALDPAWERWARRFKSARWRSISEGNALASVLQLVPRKGGSGAYPGVAAYPGKPAEQPLSGPGAHCLRAVNRVVWTTIQRLAMESETAFWSAPQRLNEAQEQLQPHLDCARRDPNLRATAERVESSWSLLRARVMEVTGYPEQGAELARMACDAGRPGGCAVAQRLESPWEVDTLFIPSVPWATDITPPPIPGRTIPLGLSQEGVYLDKQRLGDRLGVRRNRLDELVRVELNAATARPVVMRIRADNNILMQDIRDPLAAADDHKVTTQIVLKDPSGRDVVYNRPNPNAPVPSGHRVVWIDLLADRLLLSWYNSRGQLKREELPRTRYPDFTNILAHRGLDLQRKLGVPVRFRLYGAPEMPWGELAPAVSALRLRPSSEVAEGTAPLHELVAIDQQTAQGARPEVLLLIAPESPSRQASGLP